MIFDCDGVLVDSEQISTRVGVSVLAELGWHLTEDEFAETFVGCSAEHFHREVEHGLGRPLQPGWETAYSARYREAYEAELTVVPGIPELLRVLHQAGVLTGVASNSGREHLRHVLGLTGLLPLVGDRLFSAEEVARGKPAPDLFLHAARSMGVAPASALVVEDSRFGVAAAVAAGMRCVAYVGSAAEPDWVAELGATSARSMADVGALVAAAGQGDDASDDLDSPEPVDKGAQGENALSTLSENLLTHGPPPNPTCRSAMQHRADLPAAPWTLGTRA